MFIRSISLSNYMCYKHVNNKQQEVVVDFSNGIDRGDRVFIIAGSNNSGKTTLLHAISDCYNSLHYASFDLRQVANDMAYPVKIRLTLDFSDSDLELIKNWLVLGFCQHKKPVQQNDSTVNGFGSDNEFSLHRARWLVAGGVDAFADSLSTLFFKRCSLVVENSSISGKKVIIETRIGDKDALIKVGSGYSIMLKDQIKTGNELLTSQMIYLLRAGRVVGPLTPIPQVFFTNYELSLTTVEKHSVAENMKPAFEGEILNEAQAIANRAWLFLENYLSGTEVKLDSNHPNVSLADVIRAIMSRNISMLRRWEDNSDSRNSDATDIHVKPLDISKSLFDIKNLRPTSDWIEFCKTAKTNIGVTPDVKFQNPTPETKTYRFTEDKGGRLVSPSMSITEIPEKQKYLVHLWAEGNEKPILLSRSGAGILEFFITLTTLYKRKEGIVLLDEPGSMLHPPVQHNLLKLLSSKAKQENKQIIVITHSVHFVPQYDLKNAIYVSRTDAGSQIVNLSSLQSQLKTLQKVNRNLTQLLFTDGIIFCEGADDETLYTRADYELLEKGEETGAPPVIHTHGKGSIATAVEVCKKLSIRFAAIYDGDVLANRTKDLESIFETLNLKCDYQNDPIANMESNLNTAGVFFVKGKTSNLCDPETVFTETFPHIHCTGKLEKWLQMTISDPLPVELLNLYKQAARHIVA